MKSILSFAAVVVLLGSSAMARPGDTVSVDTKRSGAPFLALTPVESAAYDGKRTPAIDQRGARQAIATRAQLICNYNRLGRVADYRLGFEDATEYVTFTRPNRIEYVDDIDLVPYEGRSSTYYAQGFSEVRCARR